MNDTSSENPPSNPPAQSSQLTLVILFWLFAGVPLSWGIFQTLKQAVKLFQ